ncbi:hypothetical protein [Haloferula luteola]|uniref:hypothetical protein n=1 Tax=Haloferula luteola TaxID=595692 RepID=UPI003CCD67D9
MPQISNSSPSPRVSLKSPFHSMPNTNESNSIIFFMSGFRVNSVALLSVTIPKNQKLGTFSDLS